jgi:hypothetical protein
MLTYRELRTMRRSELEDLRRRTISELVRRDRQGETVESKQRTNTTYVVERRDHADGLLQAEKKVYFRKDRSRGEVGPYWVFRYRRGGRQRSIYLGQTDQPESVLASKRKDD